jgi:hypothetical protein
VADAKRALHLAKGDTLIAQALATIALSTNTSLGQVVAAVEKLANGQA